MSFLSTSGQKWMNNEYQNNKRVPMQEKCDMSKEQLNILHHLQKERETIKANTRLSSQEIWDPCLFNQEEKSLKEDTGRHFNTANHSILQNMKICILDCIHAHPKRIHSLTLYLQIEFNDRGLCCTLARAQMIGLLQMLSAIIGQHAERRNLTKY